jgi:hypothetical protein
MRAAQIDPSPAAPPKSRLKRLFERQLLRVSPAERLPSAPPGGGDKDELPEPSSLCLDGMVRSFLEDGGGGGGAERAAAAARCCTCSPAGDTAADAAGPAAAAAAAADIAETIKVVGAAVQYSAAVLVASF